MNKMLLGLSGMVACLIFSSSAIAQDAIVHQVAFPQGDATWSVTAQNQPAPQPQPGAGTTAAPKPPKKFQSMDIVRSGNLRRDTITWTDGSTDQMWWIQNLPLVLTDRNGQVGYLKAADMGQVRFDADSLAWVSAKTYLGKKSYQGNDSQYYETKIYNPATPGAPPLVLRAWIDPATHQPLALFNGTLEVAFTFPKQARIPALQMPPNFQELYTRLEDFYAHVKQPGN